MNQRKLLAICSTCTNRQLDFTHGYVCQLTGLVADFQGSCKDYVKDGAVTGKMMIRTEERPFVPLFDPVPAPEKVEKGTPKRGAPKRGAPKKGTPRKGTPKKGPSKPALEKLKRYQNFLYALLGGLLVALLVAVGWPFVTAVTAYGGTYLALGAGLLVGLAVRYFGAGIHPVFGFLSALLALAGSLLGYSLSLAGFPEEVQVAAIIRLPDYLRTDSMLSSMLEAFVPLDLLFYGLAFLLAWLLAIRRISKRKMARLEGDIYKGAPVLYRFRLPLILLGILVPAYYGYTLTKQDAGGSKTLYYESGQKMSEGDMRNGVETGEWTGWHDNGKIRSIGYYQEGQKDSLWKWYDESGMLTATGMYGNGVEQGAWMDYYPDGAVSAFGAYHEGLKEGQWKHYRESGSLMYSVDYKAGEMHGERILYNSDGSVVNIDYYENGMLKE